MGPVSRELGDVRTSVEGQPSVMLCLRRKSRTKQEFTHEDRDMTRMHGNGVAVKVFEGRGKVNG